MISFLKLFTMKRQTTTRESGLTMKQKNLKDFNMRSNNNSITNLMSELGIEYITFERGDAYDKKR